MTTRLELPAADVASAAVLEAADFPNVYTREVEAIAACVAALEPLPSFVRKRVVGYLADMFQGPGSLDLLCALACDSVDARKELEQEKGRSTDLVRQNVSLQKILAAPSGNTETLDGR